MENLEKSLILMTDFMPGKVMEIFQNHIFEEY